MSYLIYAAVLIQVLLDIYLVVTMLGIGLAKTLWVMATEPVHCKKEKRELAPPVYTVLRVTGLIFPHGTLVEDEGGLLYTGSDGTKTRIAVNFNVGN
jgi:hypothetical protein